MDRGGRECMWRRGASGRGRTGLRANAADAGIKEVAGVNNLGAVWLKVGDHAGRLVEKMQAVLELVHARDRANLRENALAGRAQSGQVGHLVAGGCGSGVCQWKMG